MKRRYEGFINYLFYQTHILNILVIHSTLNFQVSFNYTLRLKKTLITLSFKFFFIHTICIELVMILQSSYIDTNN